MNGMVTYVAETVECSIQPNQTLKNKVYRRRWIMLIMFAIFSASNSMQWIQFTIISNTVTSFYNTEAFWIDRTSTIFMIAYIPFIFPASYILDKYGLRYGILLGAFGNTLGAWIKVFSAKSDMFPISFLGQAIVAVSQTFVLSVPSRLAAVWFGPGEVSSACSIGVFGNQLGIAIGFLIPQMLVPSSPDPVVEADPVLVAEGLQLLFNITAGFTSIIFVLIFLFFRSVPPVPPSPTQTDNREKVTAWEFFQSVRRLCTNFGFLLLLLSYGINVGVFYAISTHLTPIITSHYPGAEADAGRIGFTITVAGLLGAIACGVILDKTHKFKGTTLGLYIFTLLGMIIFVSTLKYVPILTYYFSAGLLGFFMTGYVPVGFELATELTFPESESTSAGLLNAVCQVFGIVFTELYGYMLRKNGNDFWANVALCCFLAVGAFITLIIPNDLKRQKAKSCPINASYNK